MSSLGVKLDVVSCPEPLRSGNETKLDGAMFTITSCIDLTVPGSKK